MRRYSKNQESVTTTFVLERRQLDRLVEIAARKNTSVSYVVREAIDLYFRLDPWNFQSMEEIPSKQVSQASNGTDPDTAR